MRKASEDQLAAIYQGAFHDPNPSVRMDATVGYLAKQYLDCLSVLLGPSQFSSAHILDFGAGEGHMTRELIRRGASVVALEPFGSHHLVGLGIQVAADLESVELGSPLDGVVMTEVIEHLTDPVGTLRGVGALLKPNGWCLLTCPNANAAAARLRGEQWIQMSNPTHLALYTEESLALLAARAGFQAAVPLPGRIRFHCGLARHVLQVLLQTVGLHGNVRLVVRKAQPNDQEPPHQHATN